MIYILNFICLILHIYFYKKMLHIYQCKNYNNARFLKFFNKNTIFFIVFCIFLLIFETFFNFYWINLIINCLLIIYQLTIIPTLIINKKTPLNYTNKIKRLYFISTFLFLIFIFLKQYIPIIIILFYFSPIISNFLNIYDKILNKKFILKAQNKIKNSNTKIIAITGSNGKTSVKNILHQFLCCKFKVLKSPESYNTPLGIAKFINENFNAECEYLILEYGARRKKDIKKLCKLFGADYGILTNINAQHLETFKNIETVAKTKNELPEFLGSKLCVYNLDNTYCKELFDKKQGLKDFVSLYHSSTIEVTNIKIKNGLTHFILNIKNKSYNCKTHLLGKHNILNILLCVCLCLHLGLSAENIVEEIKNLKTIPHRLELIKSHINILDDSYNCSINSAEEALKVLGEFKGKKMVATPGIIEGGKNESLLNEKLGEMLNISDYVVIIGNHNKEHILKGLKNKSFNNKILLAQTLEDAKQYFKLLNQNDTLLLLNDLPDDYK